MLLSFVRFKEKMQSQVGKFYRKIPRWMLVPRKMNEPYEEINEEINDLEAKKKSTKNDFKYTWLPLSLKFLSLDEMGARVFFYVRRNMC